MFLDPESGYELAANLEPLDPLRFKDTQALSRAHRIRRSARRTSATRSIVMAGTLKAMPIVAAAFEFRFISGSMGSVVGERFVRGVAYCIQHRRPLVCFSASGGARMQEALYSLLQMAKTSSALAQLAAAKLPYVSVMTDPDDGWRLGEPRAARRHQHRGARAR